jgi:hypothetical protein
MSACVAMGAVPMQNWSWPPFQPAFGVRLALFFMYLGCIGLTMWAAPWWASTPCWPLMVYQAFWVVMLLRRRSQGRLPTKR